ncbi:MAG TPA: hypothetical protein VHG28_07240 [Longimicrobiaceae bacterium]|nr:hypothetical protein [Longimicrobiaceae bacterium]
MESPAPDALSERNEMAVRSALAAILREPPEAYGYDTYEGRFGWSVIKLSQALRAQTGVAVPRPTLRRMLSELRCQWRHKRWLPPAAGIASEAVAGD